jgi:hypothetical protein
MYYDPPVSTKVQRPTPVELSKPVASPGRALVGERMPARVPQHVRVRLELKVNVRLRSQTPAQNFL